MKEKKEGGRKKREKKIGLGIKVRMKFFLVNEM